MKILLRYGYKDNFILQRQVASNALQNEIHKRQCKNEFSCIITRKMNFYIEMILHDIDARILIILFKKIFLLSFLVCHCSYFHISLKIKKRMCLSDKTIVLQIMSYYMPRLCHLTTIKRFKHLPFQHAKFDFDVYTSTRVTLTNSLASKEWELLLYIVSEYAIIRQITIAFPSLKYHLHFLNNSRFFNSRQIFKYIDVTRILMPLLHEVILEIKTI